MLLLIRKDTKLKAIHNREKLNKADKTAVAYTQRYKIESNSQPKYDLGTKKIGCCLYAKIQN